MLEDVLEILLARHGGRWEGSLSQLLSLLGSFTQGWSQEKLNAELRLTPFRIERKKSNGIRKVVIHATDPGTDPGLTLQTPEESSTDPGSPSTVPGEGRTDPATVPAAPPTDPLPWETDPAEASTDPGLTLPEGTTDPVLQPTDPDPKKSNSTSLVSIFIEQQKSVDLRREVARALHVLHPQEPFEIRCLNPVRAGVFDDLEKATRAVAGANGKHKGIYFTLNPVTRPVTNRLEKTSETTSAKQIARRTWLLVDIEGRRPNTKENATNGEVTEAIKTGQAIMATVAAARPLVLCSGNGCHLLYKIDLPNTDEITQLVNKALKGLAGLHDSDGATVDSKVSDPSRISKLPGTLTRKGEHTEDRPQRHAFVLDWNVGGVLPRTQLEQWAALAVPEPPTAVATSGESKKGVKVKMDGLGRAKLWLEKRAPSIDGQGGDEQLYKTCCELVTGFLLSEEEAEEALQSGWNQRCVPPWSEDELKEKIKNAAKNSHQAVGAKLAQLPPGKAEWSEETHQDERLNGFYWNDYGNARAIVYLYGERLRWCTSKNKWMYWLGTHWQLDSKNKALVWANKTTLARLAAAELIQDEEEQKKAQSYFKSCLSTKSRNATLEQVKAWQPCVVIEDELDKDRWLLNFKNGTYNLQTGILQRHHQEDLITRLVDVDYNMVAECPKWLAFLSRAMGGNQDMIDYLQRAVGYSLTGNTREQCLFLCFGGGRNGKSVFLEVLGRILSSFSVQSPASTFQEAKGDRIPNDIARLKGSRFVRCVETDEELVFNEGLIKQMTGSDTLSARFMRGEWFDFKPHFKLWFATNHKPRVKGTDDGVWRRMRIIPWSVKITDEEVDLQLEDKLMEEAEGIMAWAVKGCEIWQRKGLAEPALVLEETNNYRVEMDSLQQWIEECCDTGPFMRESNGILWESYRKWAGPKGLPFGNEISFGRRLTAKGFKPCMINNRTRGRDGLRIDLRSKPVDELEPPAAMADPEVQGLIDGFPL